MTTESDRSPTSSIGDSAWATNLPTPSGKRLALRVTPDALRQIRGGSPWLYDGSITSRSHLGAPGDLAVIFDGDRKFAAIGLWDPNSPIQVKLLHAGAPRQIDRAWWRERISTALDRRSGLLDDPSTNAYRCIHGENDQLPGLVVDRYDSTLVIKLYSEAWFAHLVPVVDTLIELTGATRVVLRFARVVAEVNTFGLTDGDVIVGTPPTGPVRFIERSLALEADVISGQKTGHFLDQRDNRTLVRGMSEGKDVLDMFASTGGFSVAAAAGGAKSVHLVDLSPQALETARRNLDHNQHLREVRDCKVRITAGDAFATLAALARDEHLYDIVVVDPPSFAQKQASVDRAIHSYQRLTTASLAVLRPGGTLVQCSCSSRVSDDDFYDAIHEAARAAGRRLHEIRRAGHAVDHPIGFEFGGYLKAIFARVN